MVETVESLEADIARLRVKRKEEEKRLRQVTDACAALMERIERIKRGSA